MTPIESESSMQPMSTPEGADISSSRPETASNLEVSDVAKPKDTTGDRIDILKGYKPTGDQAKDIETFLVMTGRQNYIEEIRNGRVDAVKVLKDIREFQSKSLDPESSLHHQLDEDDPEFSQKSQFYRELPSHEVDAINAILGVESEREEAQGEEEGEVGQESDSEDKQELEDSPENGEKRERINQICERIERGFDSAKERMLAMEQRYDELFRTASEKFTKLSEFFPNTITKEFLDKIDQKSEVVKSAFANMYVTYESSNEQIQTMLQTLPVEFLSMEQIDSIENSTEQIFNTIDQGEENIKNKLDHLELTVNRIPDKREAFKSPEEVERAKDRTEESELIGKKETDEGELAD